MHAANGQTNTYRTNWESLWKCTMIDDFDESSLDAQLAPLHTAVLTRPLPADENLTVGNVAEIPKNTAGAHSG